MSNLFSRLKSQIRQSAGRNKGQVYPGGRYMAMLLKEVFTDEPGFAKEIFDIEDEDFVVELEHSFDPRKRGQRQRRADLVLRSRSNGHEAGGLLGVMEIKYEDERTPGVDKQIDDYIEWTR